MALILISEFHELPAWSDLSLSKDDVQFVRAALHQNIVALPAKEGRAYRERESCALAVWLEGRDELSLLHIIALETTGRLPSAVRAERVEGKLYAHCAEIGKHKAVPMGAGGVVHAASGKCSSVSAPH